MLGIVVLESTSFDNSEICEVLSINHYYITKPLTHKRLTNGRIA